jgi:hypothetical protein
MDRWNAIPKDPDAETPWERFAIRRSHNVWWIVSLDHHGQPGFYYRTMSQLMRRWRIVIVGYNCGEWIAEATGERP